MPCLPNLRPGRDGGVLSVCFRSSTSRSSTSSDVSVGSLSAGSGPPAARWLLLACLLLTIGLIAGVAAAGLAAGKTVSGRSASGKTAADSGDAEARAAAARMQQLSGIDLAGKLHHLGEADGTRATVVVFLSVECPISNGCLPELNQLAEKYAARGLECYGVISGSSATRRESVAHSKEYSIGFPVLFDASSAIRRALQPTHTPHAFVISDAGQVLYSGRVNDEYASIGRKKSQAGRSYVREAVQASLSRQTVSIPQTEPIGCLLESLEPVSTTGDVTFSRDIAPLIQSHCATCHRPDQPAPFSLLTYEDVSRHARQIVEVTKSRFMPPWLPDPDFGSFRDARHLSDEQIDLIARWVEGGKQKGLAADMPATVEFPRGWSLGQPDLILTMPEPFTISPSGPDIHQHFVIPTGLASDQLVAALEFQPGNPRAVHHASFYIDVSGEARRLDATDSAPGYGGFGGPGFRTASTLRSWLPGMSPRRLPNGLGRALPRGSDLVIEVHYQRTGKVETDQSQVGLYFSPPASRQLAIELQILSYKIDIPAGENRHHERANYTLPVATTLLDVAPHMHLLGKEVKAEAHLPNGQVIPLVWIRNWDFNWQGQYVFRRPIRLPKNTRLAIDFWYDNSAENPLNPSSPPRNVVWGEGTTAEMAICHFQCTCDSLRELSNLKEDFEQYYLRAGYRYRQVLKKRWKSQTLRRAAPPK